ncbi:hypothetical protein OPV22_024612 [Ensete ventricosum]|uniref:Protein XRI1 n=1 Tax=Ensete ventricosum TaxID=4639 RepID=A0AAV8QH89_ENSVE|nr:hypothetical protein OPV22_024612 [Ensete ventricosum]
MMALENYFLFPYHFSLDWDPHTFAVGDLHEQLMPLAVESPVSWRASTGYLQDAVAKWKDPSKQRRLALLPVQDPSPTTTKAEELQDLLQGFWDSDCHGHPLRDLNCLLQDNAVNPVQSPSIVPPKPKTQVAALQLLPVQEPLSSSSSYEEPRHIREGNGKKPCLVASKVKEPVFQDCERRRRFKKGKGKGKTDVVYPFAVVKPGGEEGDVTLADINARIMMRPRRPVRHPVGEYANGAWVSPAGRGLSGKAVVSLTRIQTQGTGTITIVRTRG